jgi:hypothetical protein
MKDDITENDEAARRTTFSFYCGPRSRSLHSAQPASEPWPKETPKFFSCLKTQRNIECITKKRLCKFSLACKEEMIGNFSTKLVLSCVRYRNGLDSLVGTGTSPRQKSEYTYKVQILLYVYLYSKRKYIRKHKTPLSTFMLVSPKISKIFKCFWLALFSFFSFFSFFFFFFWSTWWIMNFLYNSSRFSWNF